MKRIFTTIVLAALIFIAGTATAQPNKTTACEFKTDMRKAWEDHITWTRNVILNIIDDLPGTNEAVGRLLQNQVDIGNAIKPYYGNAAGDMLTTLLTSHIVIAADLLTALKNNDAAALNAANTAWITNADDIAAFLASANPHWDLMEMKMMMYDHLNLTAAEAVARKTQDYTADILAYDNAHHQILEMADMLSMGIIKQFPNKFKGASNMRVIELTDSDIILSQNMPNPFTEKTIINYFIPDHVTDAKLIFYNSVGKVIKTVVITERGEGSISILAHELSSGIYTYSIIADGRLIDTKQMVH
jgi:hypothetical protein